MASQAPLGGTSAASSEPGGTSAASEPGGTAAASETSREQIQQNQSRKTQPRGTAWLNRNNCTLTKGPIVSRIVHEIQSAEPKSLIRFLGIPSQHLSARALRAIENYRLHIRTRGIRTGNTTKKYLPIQLEFLEYVADRKELQTSKDDFLRLIRKSEEEDSDILVPDENVPYLLVTDMAAMAYIEHEISKAEECPSDLIAMEEEDNRFQVVDADEFFQEATQEGTHAGALKRQKKVPQIQLQNSTLHNFAVALAELQKWQNQILHTQSLVLPLMQTPGFKSWLKATQDRAVENRKRNGMERGRGTLGQQPKATQIKTLLENFWGMGGENLMQVHVGLQAAALFLDAELTLMRMDSATQIKYADKECVRACDFTDEATSPVPVEIFVTSAVESKNNTKGGKEFFAKLPHAKPHKCAVLHEACLMVLRHDIIGVEMPPFSALVCDKRDPRKIYRPWHSASIYCQLNTRRNNKKVWSVLPDDVEFQHGSSQLCNELRGDQFAKFIGEKLAEVGVTSTLHSGHLMRVDGTMKLAIEGKTSPDERKRYAKWGNAVDDMQLSYDQLPSLRILLSLSGADDMEEYKSFWTSLVPPEELRTAVLRTFQTEHTKIAEVKFHYHGKSVKIVIFKCSTQGQTGRVQPVSLKCVMG